MPRPKQVTDDQLILAARKVFLKHGIKAPVAAVAKALGVTPAALFHRIGSKEQLFVRSLWPADPPELSVLEARPGVANAHAQLIEILFGLTSYLSHAVPAMFLLHSCGVRPPRKFDSPPTMVRLHLGLAKWLQHAATRRQIRIKNPTIVAEALLGALEVRFLRSYLSTETMTATDNRVFVSEIVAEIIG